MCVVCCVLIVGVGRRVLSGVIVCCLRVACAVLFVVTWAMSCFCVLFLVCCVMDVVCCCLLCVVWCCVLLRVVVVWCLSCFGCCWLFLVRVVFVVVVWC